MTPTCQGSQFSSTSTTAHLCVPSTTAIENHLPGSIRTFLSKTNSTGLPPWLYGFSLWYVCWNLPFHPKLAEGSCLAPPGTSLHGDVRPCPSTTAGSARLPPSHLHQPSRVQAGTPCWEKSPLLVHHTGPKIPFACAPYCVTGPKRLLDQMWPVASSSGCQRDSRPLVWVRPPPAWH